MKINRRALATNAAVATLVAVTCFSTQALAQAYPSKPIRLVVAFSTGSGNDVIARELARYMGELLGQPMLVENRMGGGGKIATDAVAKAAPDGYTIGLGTSSQLVMNVGLFEKLTFDVERDLRSIGLVSRTPMALVASTSTPKTLKDLIKYAKKNPGKITYGSGGTGSISHVVGENFARAADISLLHVPYKGNGAALIDLAGGQINLLFDGLISAVPVAQQGRGQLLAISGSKRSAIAPNVPTFAEQGLPAYEAYSWNNLFAPAKTPQDIVDKLNLALNKVLTMAPVKERLAQGASVSLGPTTPYEADAYGQAERAKWVPFIRALRIDVN